MGNTLGCIEESQFTRTVVNPKFDFISCGKCLNEADSEPCKTEESSCISRQDRSNHSNHSIQVVGEDEDESEDANILILTCLNNTAAHESHEEYHLENCNGKMSSPITMKPIGETSDTEFP
jgi:hypothetical protein